MAWAVLLPLLPLVSGMSGLAVEAEASEPASAPGDAPTSAGYSSFWSSYTPATAPVLQQRPDTLPADTIPDDADAPAPDAADPADPAATPTDPAPDPPGPTVLPDTVTDQEAIEDFLADFTDLGVRFRGRMEMGGQWTGFRPCDADVQVTCDPGFFPQLRPDLQFGVEVGGVISNRLHVDVDYDENREFSATNNVNVVYQGMPGEAVRRVEIGDVTFDLPSSRFLSGGVPAGNFGFRADADVGPLSVQTVWAEQSGDLSSRTLRLGAGDEVGFVQDDTLVVDDADYVQGQFFFLVDPAAIDGYPHVDALDLTPADAPDSIAPGGRPIQLYRFEADPVVRQQVEGYIQAEAVAGEGADEVRQSGWFRFLEPGVDYAVHSSGLWIALRRPLTREEMLAVTYVTAEGESVGSYNPDRVYNLGGRPTLRLLKAPGQFHRPGTPTWEQEMHQVYRISGSADVDPASVGLTISLGELSAGRTFKRGPSGRDVSFLRLFGLDEESPVDELDRTGLYLPGEEYLLDISPLTGIFLVFPTLEPFARPPPVPSENLDADESAELLGIDANPGIYRDPDPFERRNGGLFRLTIPFRIQSPGSVSSFSLGALGVRDGSERIYLGDRLLVRGVDYTINYDVGQVVLLTPEALFAADPDAELRVTWEQKQVFRLAPTTVLGVRARYDLGPRGGIDFLSLRQTEEALLNRPNLGVEPEAMTLGGVSTQLRFDAGWLDGLLSRVPGLRAGEESSIEVRGEMALSLPEPNRLGAVYIDDFDASTDRTVSLRSEEWNLGSAPDDRTGAEAELPPALDPSNAAELVWQHSWVQETMFGDSLGVFEGFLPREDIDRQINIAGSPRREAGLLLTFGGGAGGSLAGGGLPGPDGGEEFGEDRWRSITTLLSSTGLDLSRSDYLEFYVALGDSLTLVVDLGQVSEDAFFVDDEGQVSGIRPGGGPWGLGLLDQEADPSQGEIWSDVADQRGVWEEDCIAERAQVYPAGDRRANCTRGNGLRDTEDLDENGSLDDTERHLRYVIQLDGSSPYLARTRNETGTAFRLFRIPLRAMAGVPVGGFSPEVDLRSVEHLRVTVAGDRGGAVALARMRIVGSRWTKRPGEGVLEGIGGSDPGLGGRVTVGPASRITEGPAYVSPPGIVEVLDDPNAGVIGSGVEFQEKSLAIEFEDVGPGDRGEVYYRFTQRPRDFLTYRSARLWALARSGTWAPDEPVYFFMKVGSDPDNFYLFRQRVSPVPDPEGVQLGDWVPEVEVDFQEWMQLRQTAEIRLIVDPPAPGDPPLEIWSADSTYAIVARDRGRAPNLAAVREVSFGVFNGTGSPVDGEIWVDELRLSRASEDPGAVGYTEMDIRGGDFLDTRLSFSRRGAHFRQIEAAPSYQDDRDFRMTSTLRMDRFAPESWGLRVPVSISHAQSARDPVFLRGSDLRANLLGGLRTPEERQTRVAVSVRREVPADAPGEAPDSWIERFVSGFEAGAGYTRARSAQVTAESRSEAVDVRLGYAADPGSREIGILPDALDGVVEALLPGFLEERLADATVRWSPERVAVRSTFFRRNSEALRFQQIIRTDADSAVLTIRSPRENLETTAHLALQPFTSLGADLDVLTFRDLLDPTELTGDASVRPLIESERVHWGELNFGWETRRTVRGRLDWRPRLVGWLDTQLQSTSYFGSLQDPNLVERRIEGADTVRTLQTNVDGRRDLRAALALDPDSLAGRISGGDLDAEGTVLGVLRALERFTLDWEDGITVRYNRQVVDPGAGLQLGWADEDRYRSLDGDVASLVVDRRALGTRGGVELPMNLVLGLGYDQLDSRSVDVRAERDLRRRTWPDFTASISGLPVPEALQATVSSVTVGSGLRATRQRIAYGSGGGQLRVEHAVAVPVNLSVSWAGGIRTTYRASFEAGVGRDPTGNTERDGSLHGITVSATFLPPGPWRDRLARPVQLTLGLQYTDELNCRISVGRQDCVAFVDQRNRIVNLTMDSQVRQLELGLQMGWVDRQSFVGRRTGSTQFQFGVFGQFQLTAGDLSRL